MNAQELIGLMSPYRHRDRLEQRLKGLGERVAEEDVPGDLRWLSWRPETQRLYYWRWAIHDGWLWGRLHDEHGRGGVWRVPIGGAVRQGLRAVARHLGPGVALLTARVCLPVGFA